MREKRPLRVGFDLDGVILYNPARTVRPVLAYFRKVLIKKDKLRFYIPRTLPERIFWWFVHKSSFAPARGLKELKKLSRDRKIEAYIITARYNSLKKDFEKWMKKIGAKESLINFIHNENNIQPHEFKRKMIEKLKLDYFVEDNWDIIRLLGKKSGIKPKILWISNILDRGIKYEHKFPNLRKAIEHIKKELSSS